MLDDMPVSVSNDAPQFVKDEIDRRNKAFMEAHRLDHLPKTWNGDSRDGKIKGCESNCVLIALSDAGALDTRFWLSIVADAVGSTLQEFAERHPKGSFLVEYQYPERSNFYPPILATGHYSAMVDGVLYNASNSAPTNTVACALEVLHKEDLKARGIDPNGPAVSIPDGTDLAHVTGNGR